MIERVGSKHPECCQHSGTAGQCPYRSVPGTGYCPMHKGNVKARSINNQELRNLKLFGLNAARAAELTNSSSLKHLGDEIAITRLTIEKILNRIQDDNDFMIYSDKISNLVRSVQVLVESLQRTQERNKDLIDRESFFAIGDAIVAVIIKHITDPDLLNTVGEEIYGCLIAGMGQTT